MHIPYSKMFPVSKLKATGGVYKRRFGFYFICLLIAYPLYQIFDVLRTPLNMSVKEFCESYGAVFSEQSLRDFQDTLSLNFSFLAKSIFSLISATGTIFFYAAFLVFPKLSAKRGLFWKVFLAHITLSLLRYAGGVFFIVLNYETIQEVTFNDRQVLTCGFPPDYGIFYSFYGPFLRAIDLSLIYQLFKTFYYLIFYAANAYAVAGILTMEEDYDDFCSCLRCLKPYQPLGTDL